MTIYDHLFPLGLGTNRFLISGAEDEAGIERAAELVLNALESGVHYIDTAHTYSRGLAHTVLRRAFVRTDRPFEVTLKSQISMDKTADAVRRRAESSLKQMGLSRAAHFIVWSIMSFPEFEQIMKKGGIYEGARHLKDEGLVDHICFSTHALPADIVRMIESGAFEGVTISYSLLNGMVMQPVLEAARRCDVGVISMNSLGGGLIAQNPDNFAFVKGGSDQSVAQAALRFIVAQPGIQVALSGISSRKEMEENLSAFMELDAETADHRRSRTNSALGSLENFCTGCNYCAGCPADIPVSAIMQSRNALLFKPAPSHNRCAPEILQNIQVLSKLRMDHGFLPETAENPCIRCGRCEIRCTQGLKICDALDDTYARAGRSGFSRASWKARLDSLLHKKGYRKVGFYPGGGYTSAVLRLYRELLGEPDFECLIFDSNPDIWGTTTDSLTIHAPDEILRVYPDCIVVSNYKFSDEIYENLRPYREHGIEVVRLHGEQDVPWVF